ncbi:hypothetical protein [Paenibacillus sp. MMO-58]|uniref:hypothetical protein n=1 Tax=Paenibacillus sp. MMO-58 TaxID=3081290 RepID=UPI003018D729
MWQTAPDWLNYRYPLVKKHRLFFMALPTHIGNKKLPEGDSWASSTWKMIESNPEDTADFPFF